MSSIETPKQEKDYASAVLPKQEKDYASAVLPKQAQDYASAVLPKQAHDYASAVLPKQEQDYASAVLPKQAHDYASAVLPKQEQKDIQLAKLLIDDVDDLKNIIRLYSHGVFSEAVLSPEMIEFIITQFIDNDFYDNGCLMRTTLQKHNKQLEILAAFVEIFKKDYVDVTTIGISHAPNIGTGGYGTVFNIDRTTAKKFIKNKDSYLHNLADISTVKYMQWMIEFCTYVVIMSIIKYIDCTIIVDESKRNECVRNKYKNVFDSGEYFLNYYSFMSKIKKPFISEAQAGNIYYIGYYIEKYDTLLSTKLNEIGRNGLGVGTGINLLQQIFEILKKLYDLSNIGITLSHRDFSTNNIMFTHDIHRKNSHKIRIIDFGFVCVNIKFKNNESKTFGYHPLENYNKVHLCDKKLIDIVFFIHWIVKYHKSFLLEAGKNSGTNVYTIFKDLIPQISGKISEWQYAADCAGMLTEKIFTDVFEILNTVREHMEIHSGSMGFEKVYYGQVKQYDLSNSSDTEKYLKIYNENKVNYLKF